MKTVLLAILIVAWQIANVWVISASIHYYIEKRKLSDLFLAVLFIIFTIVQMIKIYG